MLPLQLQPRSFLRTVFLKKIYKRVDSLWNVMPWPVWSEVRNADWLGLTNSFQIAHTWQCYIPFSTFLLCRWEKQIHVLFMCWKTVGIVVSGLYSDHGFVATLSFYHFEYHQHLLLERSVLVEEKGCVFSWHKAEILTDSEFGRHYEGWWWPRARLAESETGASIPSEAAAAHWGCFYRQLVNKAKGFSWARLRQQLVRSTPHSWATFCGFILGASGWRAGTVLVTLLLLPRQYQCLSDSFSPTPSCLSLSYICLKNLFITLISFSFFCPKSHSLRQLI